MIFTQICILYNLITDNIMRVINYYNHSPVANAPQTVLRVVKLSFFQSFFFFLWSVEKQLNRDQGKPTWAKLESFWKRFQLTLNIDIDCRFSIAEAIFETSEIRFRKTFDGFPKKKNTVPGRLFECPFSIFLWKYVTPHSESIEKITKVFTAGLEVVETRKLSARAASCGQRDRGGFIKVGVLAVCRIVFSRIVQRKNAIKQTTDEPSEMKTKTQHRHW